MFEAKSAIFLRRVLSILLAAGVVGTLGARLVDPARDARLDMLGNQHARIATSNSHLRQQNAALRQELRSLEQGDEGWRTPARRGHRMLMPGEVIFRFPTD